jgi:hypothetical protein
LNPRAETRGDPEAPPEYTVGVFKIRSWAGVAFLLMACGGQETGTRPDAAGVNDAESIDAAHPNDAGRPFEGGGANTCDAPSGVLYDCTPVTAIDGSAVMGCVGGPPQAGPPNPTEIFPVGCTATLPTCVPSFAGEVETCSCGPFPNSPTSWTCPL